MSITTYAILIAFTVMPAMALSPISNVNALPADSPSTLEVVGETGSVVSVAIHSNLEAEKIWTARRYNISQSISHAYGSPLRITTEISDNGLTEAAIRFVSQNDDALGFAGIDPVVRSIARPPNYKVVTVYAELNGIPVYDAYVILSINLRGELALLKARGFGSQVNGSFAIDEQQAVEYARAALNAPVGSVVAQQIYFPVTENHQIILLPAFEIKIDTPRPAFQPTAFISAIDGTVLASENRVHFVDIEGSTNGMYHPLFGRDEPEQGIFPDEQLNISGNNLFSDEIGEFLREVEEDDLPVELNTTLRGRWANVQVYVEDDQEYNPQASLSLEIEDGGEAVEIVWDDESSIEPERDLYFHVNLVHTFWKELVPDWDRMDYAILAVCNLGGEGMENLADNAFSNGQGIFFGRGNNFDNFALYADVVYHEYAHTVTGRVYGNNPLPYQGESGALNEAWSDYFACSLTDEPLIGEGGLFGDGGQILRNIDNNLMYPDDIVDQVHADSRIISAAMWHTREVLGVEYCDLLFHNARFHYARDFETYLMDVLITDDDNGDLTDGTPNYEEIYDAFHRHGIHPLGVQAYGIFDITFSDEIEGAEGNGDGIFDPGETIGISMTVFRGGRFEGQEGDETIIRLQSTHEGIDVIYNDISIPDLVMGSSADLPEQILFEIFDNVELSYAELVFFASADGERFEPIDSVRIVLGRPSILLVKDGSDGTDRTQWFRDPLDDLSLIFGEYETAGNRLYAEDYFDNFHSIIYFSGDSREGLLEEESQERLMDYIDHGGNVLLTGQHFDEVDDAAFFLAGWFGVATMLDSLRGISMLGVEGDPISEGMQLLLMGGNSAANQRYPGAVQAIDIAEEIFYWERFDEPTAAGVRLEFEDAEARTVYLSFGLEAVGGAGPTATRTEVTESILRWFDHPLSVEIEHVKPVAFHLGEAYPNPYNVRVTFPFRLTQPGLVKLQIYDVRGRQVYGAVSYKGMGAQHWSLETPGWGAGLYIVKLQAEGKTHISRISLVK